MSNEQIKHLHQRAFEILVDDLTKYGNDPGPNQLQALQDVLVVFELAAKGSLKGRHVLPLPTGFGKTLSIVAWITALHELGLDHISVLVGAYKVEALCDIKRSLINHGVPENKIGLIHSYEHHPDPVESPDQLPPGHASLPSTGHNDQKQFVLMTHNRINGFGKIPEYKGNQRSLVIWDESLIKSRPLFVEIHKLESVYGALEPYTCLPKLDSPSMDELYEYLESCLKLVGDHSERNIQPSTIQLPDLSPEQETAFMDVIDNLNPKEIGNLDSLKMLIKMSHRNVRLMPHGNYTLASYETVFPADLNNVVVLDASYNFRELANIDASMKKCGHHSGRRDLVSYGDVTVHYTCRFSGRHSLTKEFKGPPEERIVCIELAEVIRKIPEDQGVLIFTFKAREIDFIEIIRNDLKESGIDPDQKLADGKSRINFLTWGNETTLSRFSFCKNVIFIGVMHRSKPDIASSILGQRDDLSYEFEDGEIEFVLRSEKLHSLYQAICRGSCRIVNNDKASPMNIWLFDKDKELKTALTEIMPGLRWKAWKNTRLERETKQQEIADRIDEYLQDWLPLETTKISTSALKKELRMTEDKVPKTTFKHGLYLFLEQNEEWLLVGRSLVRLDAAHCGFKPVEEGGYLHNH